MHTDLGGYTGNLPTIQDMQVTDSGTRSPRTGKGGRWFRCGKRILPSDKLRGMVPLLPAVVLGVRIEVGRKGPTAVELLDIRQHLPSQPPHLLQLWRLWLPQLPLELFEDGLPVQTGELPVPQHHLTANHHRCGPRRLCHQSTPGTGRNRKGTCELRIIPIPRFAEW